VRFAFPDHEKKTANLNAGTLDAEKTAPWAKHPNPGTRHEPGAIRVAFRGGRATMIRRLQLSRSAIALVKVTGLVALLAVSSQTLAQGIKNSRHNLSSTNVFGADGNKVSNTDEVCVFCHTPHGASNVTGAPPLWNKFLPATPTGYTTYSTANSSTIDGNVLGIGSVSIACLSCHDGTQAMDNIINAPGSGNYDATGGGTNGLAWSWTGSPRATAEGLLTGIANLTKDLRDDHPIGIQYCGGGPTAAAPGTACRDGDFFAPANGTINAQTVFWVNTTGGTAGREKTDMILYNRDFVGAGGVGPSVECASCHDPHNNTNATFLRISNTGSAVCLACHNK
jgi:predicted CXXCH cytochrome family protein